MLPHRIPSLLPLPSSFRPPTLISYGRSVVIRSLQRLRQPHLQPRPSHRLAARDQQAASSFRGEFHRSFATMTQATVTYPVELYIYDLSGGLARQLSMAFVGRQIDAVYHTSIVIKYPRPIEVFFGQGISITSPGGSHHGRPMEVLPLGNTEVDEETWSALLEDLRSRYTPAAYNLMNFNCNNFSHECAQILVGREIPAHITSLPADFQNAMAAMSQRRGNGPSRAPPGPSPLMGLMDAFNQRAQGASYNAPNGSTPARAPTLASMPSATPDTNLFNVTSQQQLEQLLKTWPCAVALFTNTKTCPPCKVIAPVFENLARQYVAPSPTVKHKKMAFLVIESSPATMGIMSSQSIRGTPTFKFYVKGKERHQFSGADQSELRSQVELTLFDVYVAHPHTLAKPPLNLKTVPSAAITHVATPNFSAALRVLDESLSKAQTSTFQEKADLQSARKTIATLVVPWIEASRSPSKRPLTKDLALQWKGAIETISSKLPSGQLFPLIDMLRVSILDEEADKVLFETNLLPDVLHRLAGFLKDTSTSDPTKKPESNTRSLFLTTLRLLSNFLASTTCLAALTTRLPVSQDILSLLVPVLLQFPRDSALQRAASSALFNLSLWRSKGRADFLERESSSAEKEEEGWTEDQDTELLSALLEGLKESGDQTSAETIHQLLASYFHLMYLSSQISSMMELSEALDGKDILESIEGKECLKAAEKKGEIESLRKECIRLITL